MHKDKYTDAELNLGEKFYYNLQNQKIVSKKLAKECKELRLELKSEIESEGRELSYEEIKRRLEKAESDLESHTRNELYYKKLYLTMVEGADYEKIERHLLLDELEKHGVDVKNRYREIMKEADLRYKELYPRR